MHNDEFVAWLTRERTCATHVARDVESRCRRIERVMQTDLDAVSKDEAAFSRLLERLNLESASYLGVSKDPKGAVSVLMRAAKMYRDFVVSRANA